ncbi:type IV pilus biogenesis protein PilP [Noviherbaspirillum cavernae]|uniref:Type IV pilus biogenesis protein PilP n=1 Tax=Noviherbaspirillum cavernae TaxID=2320862 RepID=A0A418WVZ4_9BURK|nr:type IV pilus biogenesis protein PilP [Noviherbaspirillum cavernae]RJF96860.1 type IV pilus biogenesis protein PilP [Noviherbaspirillum cavernae]
MQSKFCQVKFGAFILVAGLACAGSAFAESASDSLTRIEAETLVLKAREKQLDVQASIIAKQNDIAAKQVVHDQLTQPSVAGDPVIRSIEGIGRKMFATLQMGNGTIVDAQAGDVLANGMRVVSISQSEVIVQSGKKKRTRLAAYSSTPTAFNPSYPNAGVSLPPPLPLMSPRGVAK